jgi:uncharacterized membrane protein
VLPLTLENIRLFLHVLAATVWVGGQLVLAGLVPALRAAGPDVPKAAARAFNRIAWPAFAVLVLTGGWNMAEADLEGDAATTLNVKMAFVVLSGVAAYLHTRAGTPRGRGVWGGLAALSALIALLLGVQLG